MTNGGMVASRARASSFGGRRWFRIALFFLGIGTFVWVLRSCNEERVWEALGGVGWKFLPIFFLELVFDAANTVGWRLAFPVGNVPGFWKLFFVRQAGTTINQVTPTATLGGEPLKAMLLAPTVPIPDGLASVILAQTTFMIAQMIFVLFALVFILPLLGVSVNVKVAMIVTFLGLAAGLFAAVKIQKEGGWGYLLSAVVGKVLSKAKAESVIAETGKTEERLRRIFSHERGAVWGSVAAHLAGRLVSLGQIWLILSALGVSTGLGICLAVSGLSILIDLPTSIVPGRVGVQEGGRVLILTALGLPPPLGFALSLVERAVQLASILLGSMSLSFLAGK
ncbi:MAG: TIGR00374 family protein [Candidatus Hydrogenedentota bacterium]|nr:MAG: TIGR00374 family protein [Candidatus Hydrogenedentota bacterium]